MEPRSTITRPGRPGARLGILLPSLEIGGAERAMRLLAGALADEGWEVDFVIPRSENGAVSVAPEVRVVRLGASRMLTAAPALARYVRRERPDALLTNLLGGNLLALALRRLLRWRIPVVAIEHTTVSRFAAVSKRRRHRLLPAAVGLAYPWADSVVAVSAGVADDLRALAGGMAVEVVPNPLPIEQMPELGAADPDEPWFDSSGPPVYLAVGRLRAEKDFPTLLRAFAQLRRRRPARLVILGDGPERDSLERLAVELGVADAVRLPGSRDNPYAHMSRCAALVLSSYCEGSPTVIAEALALGCRVVATDCPSGPRELLEEGRLGRLVPVGDASALAAAMEAALDDPAPSRNGSSANALTPAAVARRYGALLA